jgi:hypothetical protein
MPYQFSPLLVETEGIAVTHYPKAVFGSGQSDIHSLCIFHETNVTRTG